MWQRYRTGLTTAGMAAKEVNTIALQYAGILLLTILIFILASLASFGVVIWMVYLLPLMLTFLTPYERSPIYLVSLCTILIIAESILSPPGIPPVYAVMNTVIGVAVMWTVAVLLARYMRIKAKPATGLWRSAQASQAEIAQGSDASENQPHRSSTREARHEIGTKGPAAHTDATPQGPVLPAAGKRGRPGRDAIVLYDDTQRVVQLNETARQLFGAAADHMVGQTLDETLGTLGKWRANEADRSIDASMSGFVLDGKRYRILVVRNGSRSQADSDTEGDSEEVHKTMAAQTPFGLIQLDHEQQCLSVNQELSRLTGLSPEEAKEKGWLHAIHPEDRERVLREWTEITQHEGRPITFRMRSGGEAIHPVEVQVWLLRNRNGDIDGSIGVFVPVGRQVPEMPEMNESGPVKEGFSNVPEGISRGTNGVAQAVIPHGRTHGIDGQPAQVSVSHLHALTRGFSRERDTVNLQALIHSALEAVQFPLARHQVTVRTAIAPECSSVHANKGQMKQVTTNLLLNAIQAMPQGGTIRIEAAPAEDGMLTLRVADTGVGMTPETAEQAFKPFFSTKQETKATGLGLTVAKEIVEDHGGSISLESQPGQGTVVTVLLPLAPEPAAR